MGEAVDKLVALASKNVSTETREKLAKKGDAMPDGSYPIPNAEFLRRAIQSFGRAPAEKKAAVKAHIKRRAKELGCEHYLPDVW